MVYHFQRRKTPNSNLSQNEHKHNKQKELIEKYQMDEKNAAFYKEKSE